MTASIRRFAVAGALAAVMTAHAQPARQGTIDSQTCWGGTAQLMNFAKELAMGTYALTGTTRTAPPGGFMDLATYECLGSFEHGKAGAGHNGYCVMVDAQGDQVFVRDVRPVGAASWPWQYLGGTGKYAGITGSGESRRIGAFAPARPGTTQGCNQITGSYRLP